jgi:catechol 2,3-dioxygenase-like lactoylglutathione lyase family enzyme
MKIRHIGLVCRSERNADRFYGDFLGLKKSEKKLIPPALTKPLFHIDEGLEVVIFSGDALLFEIFIHNSKGEETGPIAHVCLDIQDPEALLSRARAMDVPVLRVPKGDTEVIFVQDHDGNRFEIKKAVDS